MGLSNWNFASRVAVTVGLLLALLWIAIVVAVSGMSGAEQASARTTLYLLGVVAVVLGAVLGYGLVQAVVAPLGEALKIAETVAAGDLSHDFETDRGGEFGRLLRAMGEMEDTLTDLVTRIKESSGSIHSAASEIASGNNDLSHRTEQQAGALE